MAHQTVAGNVCRGAHQTKLGQFGAHSVNLRHERDNLFLQHARGQSTFDRGGGDAGPKRFCQYEQIARTRVCIGCDPADIDNSGDGETINRFGIANGMTADD